MKTKKKSDLQSRLAGELCSQPLCYRLGVLQPQRELQRVLLRAETDDPTPQHLARPEHLVQQVLLAQPCLRLPHEAAHIAKERHEESLCTHLHHDPVNDGAGEFPAAHLLQAAQARKT